MRRLPGLFLLVALITATVGYAGIAGVTWESACIFVLGFLVLAILVYLGGYGRTGWEV